MPGTGSDVTSSPRVTPSQCLTPAQKSAPKLYPKPEVGQLAGSPLVERARADPRGRSKTHITSVISDPPSFQLRPWTEKDLSEEPSQSLQWTSPGLEPSRELPAEEVNSAASQPTDLYSYCYSSQYTLTYFTALLFIWPAVHPKNRPGQNW